MHNNNKYIVSSDNNPIRCNIFEKPTCEDIYKQSTCYNTLNCFNNNIKCEAEKLHSNTIRYYTKQISNKKFINLYIKSTDISSLQIYITTKNKKIKIGINNNILCKYYSSKKLNISDSEVIKLVIKCNNLIKSCYYYMYFNFN